MKQNVTKYESIEIQSDIVTMKVIYNLYVSTLLTQVPFQTYIYIPRTNLAYYV